MNSAHRLASWLENFSKVEASKNQNLARAMADKLNVEVGDPEYYLALASLKRQFSSLRGAFLAEVSGERQKAIFERMFSGLERFFDPIQISNLDTTKLSQRQNDIDHLFVVSEQMAQYEMVIEPDVVSAVIAQAQELQGSLAKLSIDPQVKFHLLRLLDTFIMALRGHNIFGIEGISVALGSLASELVRAGGAAATQDPEARKWTAKAKSFIKTVGAAVVWSGSVAKGASDAVEAGEGIAGLLS